MNAEHEMATADGLGGDPGPFRVIPRPFGWAVVNSETGGVLWVGSLLYKAEGVCRQRNREVAAVAHAKAQLDSYAR